MHMPPLSDSSVSYDLVIIGGGCAGLSLATAICKHAKPLAHTPHTLIIEPRTHYTDDRTWCFWEQAKKVDHSLVAKSWSSWEFSAGTERHRHNSQSGWQYHYIPSIRFYDQAERLIAEHPKMNLLKGSRVLDVTSAASHLQVHLENGAVTAQNIIDTRIPETVQINDATLKQIFFGFEVELENPHRFDNKALVMDDMRVDDSGFLFNYILPLGQNSILIEVTRFASDLVSPDTLREAALELVEHYYPLGDCKIIREESGVIPMGLPDQGCTHDSRWIRAGISAGAARPATGYAFRRIQNWADRCAKGILLSGQVEGCLPDSKLLSWMDNIFLQTIRRNPQVAPELFLALARNVRPDSLLRFLTDSPTKRDLLAVILSLPKLPLLRSALTQLLASGSSSTRRDEWREAV